MEFQILRLLYENSWFRERIHKKIGETFRDVKSCTMELIGRRIKGSY